MKRILSLTLLLVCFLPSMAVAMKEKIQPIYEERAALDDIFYIKDKRVGLCFAVINEMDTGFSFTEVPCDKVKKYIVEMRYIY